MSVEIDSDTIDLVLSPFQTVGSFSIFALGLFFFTFIFFISTIILGTVVGTVLKGENENVLKTGQIVTNFFFLVPLIAFLGSQFINLGRRALNALRESPRLAIFVAVVLLYGAFHFTWEEFQPEIMSALDRIYGCSFSILIRTILLTVLNVLTIAADLVVVLWSNFWRATRFFYRDIWVILFGCSSSNILLLFATIGRFYANIFLSGLNWIFVNGILTAPIDTDLFMDEFANLGAPLFDTLYCACESADFVWSIVNEVIASENLKLFVFFIFNGVFSLFIEPIGFFLGTTPPHLVRDVSGFQPEIKCTFDEGTLQFCDIGILGSGRVPIECLNLTCEDAVFTPNPSTFLCEGFNCQAQFQHHGPWRFGLIFEYGYNATDSFSDYFQDLLNYSWDLLVGKLAVTVSPDCYVGSFVDIPCTNVTDTNNATGCYLPAMMNVSIGCDQYYDGNTTLQTITGIGCFRENCTADTPEVIVNLDSVTIPPVTCLIDTQYLLIFSTANITFQLITNAIPWGSNDRTTSSIGPNGLPYFDISVPISVLDRYIDCVCEWFEVAARFWGTLESAARNDVSTPEGSTSYRILTGICCAFTSFFKIFTSLFKWFWDLIFGTIFEVAQGKSLDTFFFKFWGGSIETAPMWLQNLNNLGDCLAQVLEAVWFPLRCLGNFWIRPLVVVILEVVNSWIIIVQTVQVSVNSQTFQNASLGLIPCNNITDNVTATDCFFQGIILVECLDLSSCDNETSLCRGRNCTNVEDPVFDIPRLPCAKVFSSGSFIPPTMMFNESIPDDSATGCLLDSTLPVKCERYNCSVPGVNICEGFNCTYLNFRETLAQIDRPVEQIFDVIEELADCAENVWYGIVDLIFSPFLGQCSLGDLTSGETLPFPPGNLDRERARYNPFCGAFRLYTDFYRLLLNILRTLYRLILVFVVRTPEVAQKTSYNLDELVKYIDSFFDNYFNGWWFFSVVIPPNVQCLGQSYGGDKMLKAVIVRFYSVWFTIIGDVLDVISQIFELFFVNLSDDSEELINNPLYFKTGGLGSFLDAFFEVFDFLLEYLARIFEQGIGFPLNCIKTGLGNWALSVASFLRLLSNIVSQFLLDVILWIFNFLLCIFTPDTQQCDDFFTGFLEFIRQTVEFLTELFKDLAGIIFGALKSAFDWIVNIINDVWSIISDTCRLANGFIDVIEAVTNFLNINTNFRRQDCTEEKVELKRSVRVPEYDYYEYTTPAGEKKMVRYFNFMATLDRTGLAYDAMKYFKKIKTPKNPSGYAYIEALDHTKREVMWSDPDIRSQIEAIGGNSPYDGEMKMMEEQFNNGTFPMAMYLAAKNSTEPDYCFGIFEASLAFQHWDDMDAFQQASYMMCSKRMIRSLAVRSALGLVQFANSDITFNFDSQLAFLQKFASSFVAIGKYRVNQLLREIIEDDHTMDTCEINEKDQKYYKSNVLPELEIRDKEYYFDLYEDADPELGEKIDRALNKIVRWVNDLFDQKSETGSLVDLRQMSASTEDAVFHLENYIELLHCKVQRNVTIYTPLTSGLKVVSESFKALRATGMFNAFLQSGTAAVQLTGDIAESFLPQEFQKRNVFSTRNLLAMLFAPRNAIALDIQQKLAKFPLKIYSSLYGVTGDFFDKLTPRNVPLLPSAQEEMEEHLLNSELRYNKRKVPISSLFLPYPENPEKDFLVEDYISRVQMEGYMRYEMRNDMLRNGRTMAYLGTGAMMTNRVSPGTLEYLRYAAYDTSILKNKVSNVQNLLEKEAEILDRHTERFREFANQQQEDLQALGIPDYPLTKRSTKRYLGIHDEIENGFPVDKRSLDVAGDTYGFCSSCKGFVMNLEDWEEDHTHSNGIYNGHPIQSRRAHRNLIKKRSTGNNIYLEDPDTHSSIPYINRKYREDLPLYEQQYIYLSEVEGNDQCYNENVCSTDEWDELTGMCSKTTHDQCMPSATSSFSENYDKVKPYKYVNNAGIFDFNLYKQEYFEKNRHLFPIGIYNPHTDEIEYENTATEEDLLSSIGLFKNSASSNWWKPVPNERFLLNAYREAGLDVWTRAATPFRDQLTLHHAHQKRVAPFILFGVAAIISGGALNKIPGGLPGKDPISFLPCSVDDPTIVCQDCKVWDEASLLGEQLIDAGVEWYGIELLKTEGPVDRFVTFFNVKLKSEFEALGLSFQPTQPQSPNYNSKRDVRAEQYERPRYSIGPDDMIKLGRLLNPHWSRQFGDNVFIDQPEELPHITESREQRREKIFNSLDQHYRKTGRYSYRTDRRYRDQIFNPPRPLPTATEFVTTYAQYFAPTLFGGPRYVKPSPFALLYGPQRARNTNINNDPYTRKLQSQHNTAMRKFSAAPTLGNIIGSSLYRNETERRIARDIERNYAAFTTVSEDSEFANETNINSFLRDAISRIFEDFDLFALDVQEFITNVDENDPNTLISAINSLIVCEDYKDKFLGEQRNFDTLFDAILLVAAVYLILRGFPRIIAAYVPFPTIFLILVIDFIMNLLFSAGFLGLLNWVMYTYGASCSAGLGVAGPFPGDVFRLAETIFPACPNYGDLIVDPLLNDADEDVGCRTVCNFFEPGREYDSCVDDRGFLDVTDNIMYTVQRYFDTDVLDQIADQSGDAFYNTLGSIDYFAVKAERWRNAETTYGNDICNVSLFTGNLLFAQAFILIFGLVIQIIGADVFVASLILFFMAFINFYAGLFGWVAILTYLNQTTSKDSADEADAELLKKKVD